MKVERKSMKVPVERQVPNILVIDLEMNQPSEKIIELGYVIGNPLTNEIFLRRSILIDPQETISPEIIALTGITQEMVNGASSLDAAYEVMVEEVKNFSALTLIHQWGVPDAAILRHQLNASKWIFGRRWLDVKALAQSHAIIHGHKFAGGLKRMAGRIGIQVSRTEAHRADYDAEITFLVHSRLSRFFLLPISGRSMTK
jgi:DNA polymerase III alpha subunit (gram-positive type)